MSTIIRQAPRTVGELRLTRRGRLVVFVAALLVALCVGLFVATSSSATEEAGPEVATEIVTVAPGETLWGIASDVAADSGERVRDVMIRIEELNALESPLLQSGQKLRIPV